MTWLLGFARVQSAYQHLLQSWSEPPRLERSAKQVETQFRRWLAVNPRAPGACFRFGDLARPVIEVNEHYAINIEIVDSPWYGVVDDFYAAFGKALLKLAVSALAERHGDKWRLSIDQVGVFLRDTYDFNGDQPLGSWGPSGFSRGAVLAPAIPIDPDARQDWTRDYAYFSVNNASFRAYRGRFGRGGDFHIFSNVRRVVLPRAVVVDFAA